MLSELKGRHLILAKRRLYKNEVILKLSRAPFRCLEKCAMKLVYIAVFWPKSNASPFLTKIGGFDTASTLKTF